VTAAEVGEAADAGEDAVEGVGAIPGGGESSNATGAGTGDGMDVCIGGDVVLFAKLGQDFIDQETCITIIHGIVLIAAVVARLLIRGCNRQDARVNEDSDGDRDLAFVDEVVHDDVGVPCARVVNEIHAVAEEHNAGGLVGFVLGRNVSCPVACGIGVDSAGIPGESCDGALGNSWMTL